MYATVFNLYAMYVKLELIHKKLPAGDTPMTITEFLLARIAEDEAAAEQLTHIFHGAGTQMYVSEAWIQSPLKKERFLAECAAKRALVDLYEMHRANRDARRSPRARALEDEQATQDRLRSEARARVAEDALRALSAVYKDHPDYQQEWANG